MGSSAILSCFAIGVSLSILRLTPPALESPGPIRSVQCGTGSNVVAKSKTAATNKIEFDSRPPDVPNLPRAVWNRSAHLDISQKDVRFRITRNSQKGYEVHHADRGHIWYDPEHSPEERPPWYARLNARQKKAYEAIQQYKKKTNYTPKNISEWRDDFLKKEHGEIMITHEFMKRRSPKCANSTVFNSTVTENGFPEKTQRFKSCAVVGRGPGVKDMAYGPFIDSHEAIFIKGECVNYHLKPSRPCEDTSAETGKRTATFAHAMYKGSRGPTNFDRFIYIDWQLNWSSRNCGKDVTGFRRGGVNKKRWTAFTEKFTEHVCKAICKLSGGMGPSAGFYYLQHALHVCEKISVFGMGSWGYGTPSFFAADQNPYSTSAESLKKSDPLMNHIQKVIQDKGPGKTHCFWYEQEWIWRLRNEGLIQYFSRGDATIVPEWNLVP